MNNKTVTMAHGAGGKQTSELIDEVFKAHFSNPDLTADDAAVLQLQKERLPCQQMVLLYRRPFSLLAISANYPSAVR